MNMREARMKAIVDLGWDEVEPDTKGGKKVTSFWDNIAGILTLGCGSTDRNDRN